MILIAFDVDNTLDCSAGPVPVAFADWLSAMDYVAVCIVSPSGAYQGTLPRIADRASRRYNLLAFRETIPEGGEPQMRLYVSDNKDMSEAEAAGFVYIEASEFAKGLTM